MTPARKRRLSQPALDLTAAAAGALFPFSFAPYSLALLAILCVALMAVLWRHSTPRRAALRGFLFGLGQFGTGVSWVYASMHDFGGADVGEGIALTGLLVAYLAAYGALAGYCARRLTGLGAGPWQTVVGAALAWVGADWLRGWMFTGFPWLQLGYTQVDTALGLGFAPLLGGYGVAFATALVAASVSIAAGFGWTRRDRLAALCFAAAVWLVAAGLARIQWTEPAGPAIAVALIQGNIGQAQKWQPEIQKATLQHYRDLTRLHFDARVVVWPETAVPAFYHQVKDRFLRDLAAEAVARGTDLLIGMPVMDQASGRYYNALVAVGSESGMYFKRHMVPFGEYLPIRSVFGFVAELLEIPMANFERGSDRQALLRAGGYPLAASICYEDGFGHESRFGLPEAAYVVNVTNDAWFGRSLEPDQHLQMARMRALESGRYLLRATNTGVTAIVSPRGTVVVRGAPFEQAVVTGSILPMQGATPYVLAGDWAMLALLAGVGGSLAYPRWRRRGSRDAACQDRGRGPQQRRRVPAPVP